MEAVKEEGKMEVEGEVEEPVEDNLETNPSKTTHQLITAGTKLDLFFFRCRASL